MTTSAILPAGKYFVGDLCYVLNQPGEWDAFCALTISGTACLDGVFALPGDHPAFRWFASIQTEFGDGTYRDQHGNEYPVDAGLIGCILMSDIPHITKEYADEHGAVVEMKTSFVPARDREGTITFGHITIPTGSDWQEDSDIDFSDDFDDRPW